MYVCPRCERAPLEAAARGGWSCAPCAVAFPDLDGIPCLPPEPALWRALWQRRLDVYGEALEDRARALRDEADAPDLLPRTRARLSRVAEALAHERARLAELAPLLAGAGSGRAPVRLPLPLAEEEARAALECDEHVFRDWVWGAGEVDGLRAFAARLAPEPADTLAVYGAGAGRLAVDVHRSLRPRRTFALDLNPLPLWTAARLLRGETLEIHELPLWPGSDRDAVVLRRIAYEGAPPPPGFTFLIADALQPPFGAGTLDAVWTCWFIDAVAAELPELVACINRVLRPGGVWINAGPLRFQGSVARRHGIEEVHDFVEDGGFALEARDRADLPYFASPLGGTRALETVFGFAARKRAEADERRVPPAGAPALAPAAPGRGADGNAAWLEDARLPVRPTPAMVRLQQQSITAAGIISLVDGTRSLSDIAGVVAAGSHVPPAEVEPQLRAFFAGLAGA